MTMRKMTVHDRVLLALADAAGHSQQPVPYEEIVLKSWRRFPERFSLRRHPEFPDSNDQNKSLYGPLKKEGYVVSLGDMVFRLTDTGLSRANVLESGSNGEASKPSVARLSRDQERVLRTANSSEARAKWTRGHLDDIVDFDARAFFGISVTTPERERCIRVQSTKDAITNAENVRFPGANELMQITEFLIDEFAVSLGL